MLFSLHRLRQSNCWQRLYVPSISYHYDNLEHERITMNENTRNINLSVGYDIYIAVDNAIVYIGQERWP